MFVRRLMLIIFLSLFSLTASGDSGLSLGYSVDFRSVDNQWYSLAYTFSKDRYDCAVHHIDEEKSDLQLVHCIVQFKYNLFSGVSYSIGAGLSYQNVRDTFNNCSFAIASKPIGIAVGDHVEALLMHYSNAGLCSENAGRTVYGLRLYWRF